MKTANHTPNRLINEKSPYLLQHAYNPIDWYPWSEEAFQKAKQEDKPIFLSLGYSTCHWCHVMERESFEDEEVGAFLNDHFVAIKVDREERPDVDHIYMTVCQSLTGHGGWPLTVIVTPDKKPFFAGTYFPKKGMYGRPGLLDLLRQINDKWQHDRDEILKAGDKITQAIQPQFNAKRKGQLDEDTLKKGYQFLKSQFDSRYGGFGHAPKFPTPHNLAFLLRYWKYANDENALNMVEKTLLSMHHGGIYDHLGYGFSRYSTDEKWLVPHFEKMLYDNALLAMVYLECYQATAQPQYARVAKEIFTYVLRDMTSPEGGFYSAEDADSEGEEGKFYVWTPAEIKEILGEELGTLFCQWYEVTERGNFEGHNILHRIDAHNRKFDIPYSAAEWEAKLSSARKKLFAEREKRIHPHKDDKILTSWNGLMIAALAMGARIFGEKKYSAAAKKAMDFIWTQIRDKDGRLLARFRDGEAAYLGYIDDYANVVWALIELYQATKQPRYLKYAIELQDQQNSLFWDDKEGGFFFYGKDGEELLARPKEVYDGATPSGNSVSALNLLRLGRLTGKTEYEELANEVLQAFSGNVSAHPAGYTHLLMALLFALMPTKEIVVVGDGKVDRVEEMLQPLEQRFLPDTVFLYRFQGPEFGELDQIVPFIHDMSSKNNEPTFYVCQNFACQQPTTDINQVKEMLS